MKRKLMKVMGIVGVLTVALIVLKPGLWETLKGAIMPPSGGGS